MVFHLKDCRGEQTDCGFSGTLHPHGVVLPAIGGRDALKPRHMHHAVSNGCQGGGGHTYSVVLHSSRKPPHDSTANCKLSQPLGSGLSLFRH